MENSSGFEPLDYKTIVKPDEFPKKTPGGLMLPDTTVEKEQAGMQTGIVISLGPNAFDRTPEGGITPQIGDKVAHVRYAGILLKGADGSEYRIIEDEDIRAIVRS